MENLLKIDRHNADPLQTYTLGITEFADMSIEEFIGIFILKLRKNIDEGSN